MSSHFLRKHDCLVTCMSICSFGCFPFWFKDQDLDPDWKQKRLFYKMLEMSDLGSRGIVLIVRLPALNRTDLEIAIFEMGMSSTFIFSHLKVNWMSEKS